MKVYTLERRQHVAGDLNAVFDFFADALNLERITPPWLRFRVATPGTVEMRAGTLLEYRLRLHGVPIRWLTRIETWEPPHRFTDVQLQGPYRLWRHEHSLERDGTGVAMSDRVLYALPLGPLGRLAHGGLVRRDIERIFDFRRAAVGRALAPASSWGLPLLACGINELLRKTARFVEVHELAEPREFERAYREHRARALAVATRVLRDDSAAEDVVQEVFTQLWRNPGAFNPRRGPLSAYVTLIARSRALDHWRARAVRQSADERLTRSHEAEATAAPSAAEAVARREEARSLLYALAAAPDDQREAVLLAYGGGLTAKQIAGLRRVPVGTAKSRIRLGLEKARAALEAA